MLLSLLLGINKQWEVIALKQLTPRTESRPTTTETRVAYNNSIWYADKYKVHKLHQGQILKSYCLDLICLQTGLHKSNLVCLERMGL